MREMLDEKLNRFEELEAQLSDPEVQSNSSKMAAVAREHGSLAKLATKYRKFQTTIGEIDEVKEMAQSSDPDERELWDELLDMTVGGEDANRSRCVMEIRAGTGGDEAALFAHNLYEMYKKHCENKKWKCMKAVGIASNVFPTRKPKGVSTRLRRRSRFSRNQRTLRSISSQTTMKWNDTQQVAVPVVNTLTRRLRRFESLTTRPVSW